MARDQPAFTGQYRFAHVDQEHSPDDLVAHLDMLTALDLQDFCSEEAPTWLEAVNQQVYPS